jgi:hypothetical protein
MTDGVLTAEEFIGAAPWTFAHTMPENPHEYTVLGQMPDESFNAFVLHIREHGYRGRFGGRTYTYLEVDGWRYWTMGAPLGATRIINRARVNEATPKGDS